MADNATRQGIASIGIKVEINSVEMNYVQEIGDIGGAPSDLDATCLKDSMKKNVPGVQDTKSFEITYFFDNSSADSDYRKIKALQTAGNAGFLTASIYDALGEPDQEQMKKDAYIYCRDLTELQNHIFTENGGN